MQSARIDTIWIWMTQGLKLQSYILFFLLFKKKIKKKYICSPVPMRGGQLWLYLKVMPGFHFKITSEAL